MTLKNEETMEHVTPRKVNVTVIKGTSTETKKVVKVCIVLMFALHF